MARAGDAVKRVRFATPVLALGLLFVYAPIILLVVYSFNESRLVTVWGGWSTRWYAEIWRDGPLLDALVTSLRVAFVSAALATIVGTAAGLQLSRVGRRPGRLFSAGLLAPMVMPDVVIGLSLLLLAIGLGIGRGWVTIALGHAVLSTAYVALAVQARASGLDRDLEAAALDLGATPACAFRTVTLPLVAPGIVSGFLLAFTISLDDVVLASFLGGPGSTTLPVRLYSQMRLGMTPEINAVSTLLLASVGGTAVAAALLLRPRRRDARLQSPRRAGYRRVDREAT